MCVCVCFFYQHAHLVILSQDVLTNTTHIYCIIHGDFMLLYKEGADWLPNSADVDTGGRPDRRERKRERER